MRKRMGGRITRDAKRGEEVLIVHYDENNYSIKTTLNEKKTVNMAIKIHNLLLTTNPPSPPPSTVGDENTTTAH